MTEQQKEAQKTYRNYYAIKFAHEAKKNPTDWIRIPAGGSNYRLMYVGLKDSLALVSDQAKSL